jgi:hypothetical protein
MLADAKTRGSKDGDFINPNQQGALIIHKLIDHQKAAKRSVILVAEVLEASAKVAGAQVQAPKSKVKKVYSLSKYDWAIDELKTDLINMSGADEKTLSKNAISEMFKEVFENNALAGVVVGFEASELKREGKPTLTKVNFSEVTGDINSPEAIAARAKTIG